MRITRVFPYLLTLLAAIAPAAGIAAPAADAFIVSNLWVRATVPGQTVAGAYMDIATQTAAALVGVDSPVAGKAELHVMSMEGGMMKMRPVVRIALPASQTVSLKPGGYHVMLLDLKRQLKAGERVPLELTLRTRQGVKSTLKVEAEVRAINDEPAHHK